MPTCSVVADQAGQENRAVAANILDRQIVSKVAGCAAALSMHLVYAVG